MYKQDDLIYLVILLLSFALSLISKRLPYRDFFNGLAGLFLVWFFCGQLVVYSLVCVTINSLIIAFAPKNDVHRLSFVVIFGYLAFCRCAHFLGLPAMERHANAVQLLMTLRCIGLAFEVFDARVAKKADPNSEGSLVEESPLKMFLYCYNFIGLFTGPYYSYKVHSDMIRSEHLGRVRVAHEIFPRVLCVPPLIVLLLLVSAYFPVEFVHTEDFYETHGFLARLLYMVPVFVFLRVRCYIAWTLSEAACIANCLGAYPQLAKPRVGRGPTDLQALKDWESSQPNVEETEFNFETIHNVDIYACEFSPGFRSGMRAWNRSVQFWLATYVYKRSGKSIRMPWTMLVSAFWHGIHPGYYLSFLTVPLCTFAEDQMFSAVGDPAPAPFAVLWWFFRMRGFDYMCMGFLLLSWTSTLRYWASIYFIVHIICAACIVGASVFKTIVKEKRS